MSDCEHNWISNDGKGGVPVFEEKLFLGPMPFMMARCSECHEQVWMTQEQWHKYGGSLVAQEKSSSWWDRLFSKDPLR